MTTTEPSRSPDPTRSGAVWVTGMGAFLLLAAAAVFTAVRWEQIPDAAKLAALVAATGGCLLASRALRDDLPATSGALLHLGAFLVPIDVAAIGVRAGLAWPSMLLAQGLVATVTFGLAAAAERSVVLRWAFGAAVVALAGGVGATSVLPAPLVLAAFAAGALVARRDDEAIAWAAVAGVAPLLTFLDELATGSGTLERLGLLGTQPRALALLTGGVAATVLAAAAQRRGDVGLALLGAGSAAVGVAASWTGLDREPSEHAAGLAVAFLVVQAAAYVLRGDPFWARPARIVAQVAELPARLGTAALVLAALTVPFGDRTDVALALAAGVFGLAWAAADLRHEPAGRLSSTIGVAAGAVGAVAFATASRDAVALSLVAVTAAAVLLPSLGQPPEERPARGRGRLVEPRRGTEVVAVAAALTAPSMGFGTSAVAVLSGVAGATLLAEAAVRRSRAVVAEAPVEPAERPLRAAAPLPGPSGRTTHADPTSRRTQQHLARAWALTVLALVPGGMAVGALAQWVDRPVIALVAGAIGATVLAAVADRGATPVLGAQLGTTFRASTLLLVLAATELDPLELGITALAAAALSAADAVRLRQPAVALGASLALPVAIGALASAAGLALPQVGVALTVSAAVIAGLGSQLGRRWEQPVGAAVGVAVAGGLALAAGDAAALGEALMVSGGIGVALAVTVRNDPGFYAASALVTSGIWLRLATGGVGASEPYLAPVALLLVIAGMQARAAGRTSSWIAYGPAVGLLGGAALLERLAGGAGWHAVVAGAVGVCAVAIGGARRLAAPLLLGSALLVALVGFETLAITSGLPTWVWLGLGGATLLGAGIAMERHDTGPIETGRRLVDVVTDRYA